MVVSGEEHRYLIMFEGKSYSDEDLANHHNDTFVALGSSLPCLDWLPLPVDGVHAEFYISVEDTEKVLLSSKLHSSAGPDEIPTWFLHENASVMCRPLSSIFSASVREGFVPSLWKPNLDRSLSHRSLVRSSNRFPTNGFLTPFR